MNAFELSMHIANTKEHIDYKPSSITLTPVTRQRTSGGGYKDVDDTPRAAQTFRIIELGSNQAIPVIQLTDGSQREVEFWLLGMPDAQVAVNDHWTATDGSEREWLVAEVVRSNLYEVRAMVVERGR